MKKYKYSLSLLTKILVFIVIACSLSGAGWSIFNLVQFAYLGALKIISYVIITLLCLCVCFLALSVIFLGYYNLTEDKLIFRLGIIKSDVPLTDITQVTFYSTENKLVIYFKNGKYSVIVISADYYEDFVLSIRERNPEIAYDIERKTNDDK